MFFPTPPFFFLFFLALAALATWFRSVLPTCWCSKEELKKKYVKKYWKKTIPSWLWSESEPDECNRFEDSGAAAPPLRAAAPLARCSAADVMNMEMETLLLLHDRAFWRWLWLPSLPELEKFFFVWASPPVFSAVKIKIFPRLVKEKIQLGPTVMSCCSEGPTLSTAAAVAAVHKKKNTRIYIYLIFIYLLRLTIKHFAMMSPAPPLPSAAKEISLDAAAAVAVLSQLNVFFH